MSSDINGNKDGKGFGGFGELVSDVSDDIKKSRTPAPPVSPGKALRAASEPARPTADRSRTGPEKQEVLPPSPDTSGKGGGAVWGWLAVIGLLIFVFIVVFGDSGKTPSAPRPVAQSRPAPVPVAQSPYLQGINDIVAANAQSLDLMLSGAQGIDPKIVDKEAAAVEKLRQAKPVIDKSIMKESRALNELGLRAHKAGDRETAAKQFFEAYKLNPFDTEISENLGIALYAIFDYPSARKAFYSSLASSPRRASSWVGLGKVFAVLNDSANGKNAFALAFRYSKSQKATRQALLAVFHEDLNEAVKIAAGSAVATHYSSTVAAFLKPILGNLAGAGVPVYLPTKVAAQSSEGTALEVYALNNDLFPIEVGVDGYSIRVASEVDCRDMSCLIGGINARRITPSDSDEGDAVELHGGIRGMIIKEEFRNPEHLVFRLGDVRYSFALGSKVVSDVDAANTALRFGALPVETFSSLPKYSALPASLPASLPAAPQTLERPAYVAPAPQARIVLPTKGPACDITYDIALETFGEGVTVELRYGRPGGSKAVNILKSSGGNVHFGELCPGSYFLAIGDSDSVSVTPVKEFDSGTEYRSSIRMQRGSGNVTSRRRNEL